MNTIARLNFANGALGFERCIGPDGKQFLRAFIYSSQSGRTSSSGVDLPEVADFLREAMRQVAFAYLNAQDDNAIVDAALAEMIAEIRAENSRH